MAGSVKFTDNSEIFLGALALQMQDAEQEIENILIDNAEWEIFHGYHEPHGPDGHTEIYQTGELLRSIEAKAASDYLNVNGVGGFTTELSANTKYAMYVHQGTRKLHGRPFIRDAMKRAVPEIKSTIERHLKH